MPQKTKISRTRKQNKLKKIEEVLIKIGLEIARKGEGALFVISDHPHYKILMKQKIEPFSVFSHGAEKILVSLATIDGAVIVNTQGKVLDYGAMIKSKKVFPGYGTRHAAAYSASLDKDTTSILVSEEEKKVKIMKHGKLIMQFDALARDVEKHVDQATDILESAGFGAVSSLGVSLLAPMLGIALVPGIIMFGLPYYILKKVGNKKIKF